MARSAQDYSDMMEEENFDDEEQEEGEDYEPGVRDWYEETGFQRGHYS